MISLTFFNNVIGHKNKIKEIWQTWCMRRTENPKNVIRVHEFPLKRELITKTFNKTWKDLVDNPKQYISRSAGIFLDVAKRESSGQFFYGPVAQLVRAAAS